MELPPMSIWGWSVARAGGIEAPPRGRPAGPMPRRRAGRRGLGRAALAVAGAGLERLGAGLGRAGGRLAALAAGGTPAAAARPGR